MRLMSITSAEHNWRSPKPSNKDVWTGGDPAPYRGPGVAWPALSRDEERTRMRASGREPDKLLPVR